MDGPGDDHTKWSKSEKDKYCISRICGLKKNDTVELIYRTETDSQTYGYQTYGYQGGNWDWHVHNAMFRINSQPRPIV